ncbi:branched-chain amino acid aminotransferase [Elstera sp.]|jgi:branched-chain amino acid aminotransferase|uniref:branched-chain amino acid aminotransferase n=1 Tax=Elstera sp. TaxID=1916664 RepID=UPI0037C1276F
MRTITYLDGTWSEGNTPLMGASTQAGWLAHTVFDGARAFGGLIPDLALHCERVIRSAKVMAMEPPVTAGEIYDMAKEGIRRFPAGAELYIRPMFWMEEGLMVLKPESTRFALVIQEIPLPPGEKGFSATLSHFRRPSPEIAPTAAKASCLYPQATLALREAMQRGFENAVMCDLMGNVAEFTGSNILLGFNGELHTPTPNGSLLNGITRQRVISLLREAGVTVVERAIRPQEVAEADEIISTGNYAKVQHINRYEDRDLQPGPLFRKARELYFKYAEGQKLD